MLRQKREKQAVADRARSSFVRRVSVVASTRKRGRRWRASTDAAKEGGLNEVQLFRMRRVVTNRMRGSVVIGMAITMRSNIKSALNQALKSVHEGRPSKQQRRTRARKKVFVHMRTRENAVESNLEHARVLQRH